MMTLSRFSLLWLALSGACDRAGGADAGHAVPPVLEVTTSRAVAAGDDPTEVAADAVSTPAMGARKPLVVVTLFTDYQCENCRRQHDVAARLLDRWPDEVQVQFRQMPLGQHPLARFAAMAALAAHRQGRFACMNSALVRSRLAWTRLGGAAFEAFVKHELVPFCGLAPERFASDVKDARLGAKVRDDLELATELEVRGTPAVLVDGLEARFWPRPGVKPALLLNALVRRSLRDAHAQLAACGAAACDEAAMLTDRVYGNLGDPDKTMRLLDAD